jgi:hypothetical protein
MEGLKIIAAVIMFMSLMVFLAVPAGAQMYGGSGEGYGDVMARGDQMGPMGPYGPMGPMSPFMPMSPFSGGFGMWSGTPNYNVHNTNKTIMAFMEDYPELSLYIAALKATGYDKELSGGGSYAVFAINNTSMARDLSINGPGQIYSNPDLVRGLVESSIARDSQGVSSLAIGRTFRSLNGLKIAIGSERNGMAANGADVTDIVNAGNGVLYVTDAPVGT